MKTTAAIAALVCGALAAAAGGGRAEREAGPDGTSTAAHVGPAPERRVMNIAHRGASAYAPEHTRAAYQLALEQGADFVEQDLQITRDGVLVCLHDGTLERTTNVREVFPDRGRPFHRHARVWPVADFTLEEIRRLDAGSWFDRRFAGERVLTFQEAIDLMRGRAGLFPELKDPERYAELGFDMERLVLEILEANGLGRPAGDPATPVILQSFSAASLRRLRDLGSNLPRVLLVSAPDTEGWLSAEGLERARAFAAGIGPAKRLLLSRPAAVASAREAGLLVTPYTFRSADVSDWPDVEAEMAHYLYTLGADGVFTDNPDMFPRRPPDP